MASDVDWIARFRAESERIAQYDPEYAAALPQTLLLAEIDRLTAELGREREMSQQLMEQRKQMAAERYVWQERGDRYRAAWRSARRRAADRRRAGERLPGGAIRQALIDAGIITAEDRVADAVEKIRALGPRPACKHGVLPAQGLCLYCAAERNLPTTKESER